MVCLLFVFQGHAAPILYAVWAEAGLFDVKELLNLRKFESDLEGHPTPVCIYCFELYIGMMYIMLYRTVCVCMSPCPKISMFR